MNSHRKSLGGFRWALWLGFALAVAIPFSATKAAECSLTMGMEDWPPYLFRDSQGNPTGIDVEIMRKVAARTGCGLNFVEAKIKRIWHDVGAGRMDIVIAYFKPGREEIGRYSKSHRKTTVDLHVLEGRHGGIRDLGSFLEAGLHLGIVRGVFYGDPAMRLLASPSFKAQIEEVSTNRQNLKKLLVGRLDGIIVNPFTASEFMRETDAVGKLERRSPVLRTDVYFFFSKVSVSDEVVDAIDRAIETFRQDGTIDKILARYPE